MDRPKDNTPPGAAPRDALAARGVTAADIVAYLRQNPDFLLTHPELRIPAAAQEFGPHGRPPVTPTSPKAPCRPPTVVVGAPLDVHCG